MNDIQIFNNPEFGQVRTVEIDGEVWLVGKDVALALGYTNPRKALDDHVDAEDKLRDDGVTIRDSIGRDQHPTIINESGLYALVLSSKLPTAKKFRRWVTSEVLPAIRSTGGYIPTEGLSDGEIMARAVLIAQRSIEDRDAKIRALTVENERQRQAIADFEPIRQYVDQILESPGTLATTQVAADYGLSAKRLNQILHEAGIQYNVNGQWILYKKHMGKGYTKSKTIHITHTDGRPDTKMQTQWTQKGRLLINTTLNQRGIQAVMDRAEAV